MTAVKCKYCENAATKTLVWRGKRGRQDMNHDLKDRYRVVAIASKMDSVMDEVKSMHEESGTVVFTSFKPTCSHVPRQMVRGFQSVGELVSQGLKERRNERRR